MHHNAFRKEIAKRVRSIDKTLAEMACEHFNELPTIHQTMEGRRFYAYQPTDDIMQIHRPPLTRIGAAVWAITHLPGDILERQRASREYPANILRGRAQLPQICYLPLDGSMMRGASNGRAMSVSELDVLHRVILDSEIINGSVEQDIQHHLAHLSTITAEPPVLPPSVTSLDVWKQNHGK